MAPAFFSRTKKTKKSPPPTQPATPIKPKTTKQQANGVRKDVRSEPSQRPPSPTPTTTTATTATASASASVSVSVSVSVSEKLPPNAAATLKKKKSPSSPDRKQPPQRLQNLKAPPPAPATAAAASVSAFASANTSPVAKAATAAAAATKSTGEYLDEKSGNVALASKDTKVVGQRGFTGNLKNDGSQDTGSSNNTNNDDTTSSGMIKRKGKKLASSSSSSLPSSSSQSSSLLEKEKLNFVISTLSKRNDWHVQQRVEYLIRVDDKQRQHVVPFLQQQQLKDNDKSDCKETKKKNNNNSNKIWKNKKTTTMPTSYDVNVISDDSNDSGKIVSAVYEEMLQLYVAKGIGVVYGNGRNDYNIAQHGEGIADLMRLIEKKYHHPIAVCTSLQILYDRRVLKLRSPGIWFRVLVSKMQTAYQAIVSKIRNNNTRQGTNTTTAATISSSSSSSSSSSLTTLASWSVLKGGLRLLMSSAATVNPRLQQQQALLSITAPGVSNSNNGDSSFYWVYLIANGALDFILDILQTSVKQLLLSSSSKTSTSSSSSSSLNFSPSSSSSLKNDNVDDNNSNNDGTEKSGITNDNHIFNDSNRSTASTTTTDNNMKKEEKEVLDIEISDVAELSVAFISCISNQVLAGNVKQATFLKLVRHMTNLITIPIPIHQLSTTKKESATMKTGKGNNTSSSSSSIHVVTTLRNLREMALWSLYRIGEKRIDYSPPPPPQQQQQSHQQGRNNINNNSSNKNKSDNDYYLSTTGTVKEIIAKNKAIVRILQDMIRPSTGTVDEDEEEEEDDNGGKNNGKTNDIISRHKIKHRRLAQQRDAEASIAFLWRLSVPTESLSMTESNGSDTTADNNNMDKQREEISKTKKSTTTTTDAPTTTTTTKTISIMKQNKILARNIDALILTTIVGMGEYGGKNNNGNSSSSSKGGGTDGKNKKSNGKENASSTSSSSCSMQFMEASFGLLANLALLGNFPFDWFQTVSKTICESLLSLPPSSLSSSSSAPRQQQQRTNNAPSVPAAALAFAGIRAIRNMLVYASHEDNSHRHCAAAAAAASSTNNDATMTTMTSTMISSSLPVSCKLQLANTVMHTMMNFPHTSSITESGCAIIDKLFPYRLGPERIIDVPSIEAYDRSGNDVEDLIETILKQMHHQPRKVPSRDSIDNIRNAGLLAFEGSSRISSINHSKTSQKRSNFTTSMKSELLYSYLIHAILDLMEHESNHDKQIQRDGCKFVLRSMRSMKGRVQSRVPSTGPKYVFFAIFRFLADDRRPSDAMLAYLNQRTIRFVLSVLRRYPFDYGLYEDGLSILDEMVQQQPATSSSSTTGAVYFATNEDSALNSHMAGELVVFVFETLGDDAKQQQIGIVRRCCELLVHLMENIEQIFGQCLVASNPNVGIVLNAMGNFPNDPLIRSCCKKILTKVCNGENIIQTINQEEIGRLLKYMKDKRDVPIIQLAGCSLLCAFAQGNNDNRLYIATEGGIRTVLTAMAKHNSNERILEAAMTTLHHLPIHLVERDTVSKFFATSKYVQFGDWGTKAHLEKARMELIASFGVQATLDRMKSKISDPNLQCKGCVAIGIIIGRNTAQRPAVTGIGNDNSEDNNAGIYFLSSSSWPSSFLASEANPIHPVGYMIELIRRHENNGTVVQEACKTLVILSQNCDEFQTEIFNLGAVTAMVKALKKCGSKRKQQQQQQQRRTNTTSSNTDNLCLQVQDTICAALHDLAIGSEDILTAICADDIKETIVQELSNQRVTHPSTCLLQLIHTTYVGIGGRPIQLQQQQHQQQQHQRRQPILNSNGATSTGYGTSRHQTQVKIQTATPL